MAPSLVLDATTDYLVEGDNLEVLGLLPSGAFQMIYIDPPFNTGRIQRRTNRQMTADVDGDRTGFRARRYTTTTGATAAYDDDRPDYLEFLGPRLVEARRVLADTGTIYVHLDAREVHYVKVLLDGIFTRECFLNEIIWAYDYGARATRRWPAKHDTILVYVKDRHRYHFDSAAVDREPYMAPGLVTPEKAARGKLPTDVWWHTIVSPTGREKTGYPTQKPEAVVRRMVLASSRPGDRVLDFFAGSGTLGAVAVATGRRHVLVDDNPEAIAVISGRLGGRGLVSLHCTGGRCGQAPASLSRRVTADEPSGTGAPTQSADPPT
jgi:site-specific DNA-methyltransferase (adenine-specific)